MRPARRGPRPGRPRRCPRSASLRVKTRPVSRRSRRVERRERAAEREVRGARVVGHPVRHRGASGVEPGREDLDRGPGAGRGGEHVGGGHPRAAQGPGEDDRDLALGVRARACARARACRRPRRACRTAGGRRSGRAGRDRAPDRGGHADLPADRRLAGGEAALRPARAGSRSRPRRRGRRAWRVGAGTRPPSRWAANSASATASSVRGGERAHAGPPAWISGSTASRITAAAPSTPVQRANAISAWATSISAPLAAFRPRSRARRTSSVSGGT